MSGIAHQLRWLPNAITIARLACLPVLLVMLLVADGPTSLPAAIFFAALALTDLIDGALARALKATSNFGRIADPLADRMLMAVGLIGVLAMGRFAWPGPLIILIRDALTIAGFVWLARVGVVMRIDFAGKVSSGLNMGVVAVGMAFAADYINWVFLAAVILSLLTFANYVRIAVVRLRSPSLM